ncbi:hypothetical protein NMG60_11012444 [Bertholletia excelsa]
MVMDKQLRSYCGLTNRIRFEEEFVPILSDQSFVTGFRGRGSCGDKNCFILNQPCPPDLSPNIAVPPSSMMNEGDFHEDCDFSDAILKYIDQMLMEEDMEEKTCMFQESAALQAAERSLYEAIGEQYPPPNHDQIGNVDQNIESPKEYCFSTTSGNCETCSSSSSSGVIGPVLSFDLTHGEYESPLVEIGAVDLASKATSQSSISTSSNGTVVVDGLVDSAVSTFRVADIFNDSQSFLQFKRGADEASKFLPRVSDLSLDSGTDVVKDAKEEPNNVVVKVEKYDTEKSFDVLRGKKNPFPQELDVEEGRSSKQSAIFVETTVRSEMFDMVLLCNRGKTESALREALQSQMNKNMQQSGQSNGPKGGKARVKKKGGKRDVVDLRTLLTLCAQAVATDDHRSANELLKQIRQHSSPLGDGMQRVAHYFANGLEARMAGSGTQSYTPAIVKPTSATDILKAYHLFLAVCPFKKIANFFANRTIMKMSEKASSLHIIDFGILYGFQWPCLIQKLASRAGGPPKLRITGIDFPNSGFRPAGRVEETGRRLANYAESFNVPFQFNAIAKKWETIRVEDLKLKTDEFLVVNCQCRFRNLLDETVMVESPRDTVLNLIRKINPDLYHQGVVNGAYNAPFFISRFREALFHFSSLFDMLETNVPREIHERMLIEKEILGWEVINVIACEGAERIERPETYKQWQVRNLRAGFRQLPLDSQIVNIAKERVNKCYHKDFLIDVDGRWTLLGWKGRIIYAHSSWKPA